MELKELLGLFSELIGEPVGENFGLFLPILLWEVFPQESYQIQ